MELSRIRRGAAVLSAGVVLCSPVAASGADRKPHVGSIRCAAACAGSRKVTAGSLVRWGGRHLAAVDSVRFPASGARRFGVRPLASTGRLVKARVPRHAVGGRPILATAGGRTGRARAALRVVPRRAVLGPRHFRLLHSRAKPGVAFFDGGDVRLRYRFAARGPRDVELKLVRRATGAVVDRIAVSQAAPFVRHRARWSGLRRGGSVALPGAYELRVGRPGSRGHAGDRFALFPFEFPVRGGHGYGGPVQRFGAPRSGGRVHQGQDVLSPCGTREVAARGGRVQAKGYDPRLYGNWLVIDARKTRSDYRYVHLRSPTRLRVGERVRTGQTVGRVGRTGNARSVGCMLHFEDWPAGWLHGEPVDPLGELERWDGWS